MYEMLIGERPYRGSSRKEIRDKILSYQAEITANQKLSYSLSDNLVDFVNSLLKRRKHERLGSKFGVIVSPFSKFRF